MVEEVMEKRIRGDDVERPVVERNVLGLPALNRDVAHRRVDPIEHGLGGIHAVALVENACGMVQHETGSAAHVQQAGRTRPRCDLA